MVRPKLINQDSPDGESSKETIQNSGSLFLSLLFKLPFPGVKTIMIKMMMEFTFGKEDCWKIAHSEANFRFYQ